MRVLSAVRAPLMQVQMHSFDNGSALNKKLDNWDQIVKFCDRKQISIPHSLIDEAALCARPVVAPARIQSSPAPVVCVHGARGRWCIARMARRSRCSRSSTRR